LQENLLSFGTHIIQYQNRKNLIAPSLELIIFWYHITCTGTIENTLIAKGVEQIRLVSSVPMLQMTNLSITQPV